MFKKSESRFKNPCPKLIITNQNIIKIHQIIKFIESHLEIRPFVKKISFHVLSEILDSIQIMENFCLFVILRGFSSYFL